MANNQSLSVDRSPTLMENAPNWKESTATESEADVSDLFVCVTILILCICIAKSLFL